MNDSEIIAKMIRAKGLDSFGSDTKTIEKQSTYIASLMKEDEGVFAAAFAKATINGKNYPGVGILLMTNKRVMFGYKYFLGKAFFDAPIDKEIKFVQTKDRLVFDTSKGEMAIDFSGGLNLELLEEDDAVRAEVNTKINTFLEWFGSSVKTFVKA